MNRIEQVQTKERVIIGAVELPMGVTHLSITHLPRQTFNQPIGIQGATVRERGVKDVVINITTVFADEDINKEPQQAPFSDLRSLIVELRNIPFLPIYSDELIELVNGSFGNINIGSGNLSIMNVGLTTAVQSVRLSSVQGHPNAIQIDMSFLLTNISTATGGLVLYKDYSNDSNNISNPKVFMYSSSKVLDMIKKLRKQTTSEFVLDKINGIAIPSMTLTINAERGIDQYKRYISSAISGNRLFKALPSLQNAMENLSDTLTRASTAITDDEYKRSVIKDVTAFSASFSNTLVPITLSSSPVPTHQYLGSSPIQFQLGVTTSNKNTVKNIVGLNELVLSMSKNLWFFHGYLPLKIESPITGLLNVGNISITGIDFGSIDGNSNSYQMEINAISNDTTDYIEQLNQAGTVDVNALMNAIASMENFTIDANKNWIDVKQSDTTNGQILPSVENDMKHMSELIHIDVDSLVGELARRLAMNDDKNKDIIDTLKIGETKEDIAVFEAFSKAIGGIKKLGLSVPATNSKPTTTTQYKCTSVIDGDTLTVMKDDEETTIRFSDIDAPETLHPYGGSLTKPVGEYANQAAQYVQAMINNANNYVMLKDMGKGAYDRQVATVFVKQPDGSIVNLSEELLKKGLAVPLAPQDSNAYSYFQQAFNNKAGVFSEYNTAPTYTPSQFTIDVLPALNGKLAHVQFTVQSAAKETASSGLQYWNLSGNGFNVRIPYDSTTNNSILLPSSYGGATIDVYGQLIDYNDALTMSVYIPGQINFVKDDEQ